jgi:hypothetical protein
MHGWSQGIGSKPGDIMSKRHLKSVIIAVTVLSVLLSIGAISLSILSGVIHASSVNETHASTLPQKNTITNINRLTHISVVGSTQFIIDKKGYTASVDPNPYDVQIVPPITNTLPNASHGSIHSGDLVATNIGNADTGNTLVLFPARVGPGHLFNYTYSSFSGLAKEVFNVKTGTDWVTNFSKNDVEIFNPSGTFLTTVYSSLFQKPWGIASNGGLANQAIKSTGSFFVANAANATIDRIDVITVNGAATFKVTQIAQLSKSGNETKIALTWAPTLKINKKQYTDVLLALDPSKNRVAAFPNSTTATKFTGQGITAFQGKPLNNPGGIALNPFNNDLLVVNLNDNNLLELNTDEGSIVGTRVVDNVPVDVHSGNGSALFGVTAGKDTTGNLVVYFTDDNTNTVDMLGV